MAGAFWMILDATAAGPRVFFLEVPQAVPQDPALLVQVCQRGDPRG